MTESAPGLLGFRIAATSSAGLDFRRLDAIWAAAGELEVFSAGWMSDHLSDASLERNGVAFESFTTLAALAHRVPGKWIGIAVVSNTFRHPAVVAKAAVALDNVTGGRFILGLGAGWHEGEHAAYGVPLAPILERFERYEHAVETIHALFSDAAGRAPGVTRDDPFYPLDRATIEPRPLRPGGPALWLGGQRRRGIALAANYADGWIMPGNMPGALEYFADRRAALLTALEAEGRDPAAFGFAGQLVVAPDAAGLREARELALRFVDAGATHLTLGVMPDAGVEGLRDIAREVAEPVRDRTGRP
ncbi:MAG TPA: LLM class flavin-dependent oxidoreductase [Candidatus Limnocylindrales bacterium]|nr:LLM class flavin-dependent oxidoreductase [Candidatus Limnocylindrales bacterium]